MREFIRHNRITHSRSVAMATGWIALIAVFSAVSIGLHGMCSLLH